MKKRIFSIFLSLCMMASLLPTVALAASSGGTIAASSTQEELEAIFGTGTVNMSGQDSAGNSAIVITLAGDVSITGVIKVTGGNFVIKGGNITTTIEDVFKVTSGATLTLGADLTVNSTNTVIYANGGTINIEGAVLTVTGETGNPTAYADNGGTITLNSGAVSLTGRDMVTMNAGVDGTININGGSVCSGNSSAIVAAGGTVNITGGSVSTNDGAFSAVYAKKNGTVNVTGGTVSNPDGSTSAALIAENTGEGGGKVVVSEDAMIIGDVLGHGSTSGNASAVQITGGTVTGNVSVKTTATADITGGNITGDVVNNGTGDVTISGGTVGGKVTNSSSGSIEITGGSFSDTTGLGDYINSESFALSSSSDTTTSSTFTTYTINNVLGGMTYIVQTAASDSSAVSYVAIEIPAGATTFKFTVPNNTAVDVWETEAGLTFDTDGAITMDSSRHISVGAMG